MSKELNTLFSGELRWKKSKENFDVKKAASDIVKRKPQAMVKITGFAKGSRHIKAHLDYVSRNGQLEVEDRDGHIMRSREEIKEKHKEWASDLGRRKENTRDTTNIVLSMPPGTKANGVKDATREFAKETFGDNHDYVFVLHEDEKHPHVHLTVKNYGFDKRRLHIKKGDPQLWRESFVEKLKEQGIEASATSRRLRGVVKKSESQAIVKIRERGEIPITDKKKVAEVIREAEAEKRGQKVVKPWEAAIARKQIEIRKDWLNAAEALKQSSSKSDVSLASQIEAFVKNMPELKTVRQEIKSKLFRNKDIKQEKIQEKDKGKDLER